MSAHTKAPWVAQRSGAVTTESGEEIAHVFEFKNLPMVAASPELLAALQECMQNTGGGWIAASVIERARAVIAKATGSAA